MRDQSALTAVCEIRPDWRSAVLRSPLHLSGRLRGLRRSGTETAVQRPFTPAWSSAHEA
ncbi:hypothetical protein METH_15535 [Leisingera methylohalidivorans DSM 14336]|uniref:Uncharacterized protein n=1 Tax=Leisingera methylohalidivorans DSM 14336 TaxID=999552 RepID=V9W1X1_9RHOB|nr:hypothetical protein METH_15535 [Leisingera methylohalidivorans DSM 14336]